MELTNPTSTPLPPWASGLIPDLHDAIWSGGGHHDHAAWCALEVLQRRGLLVQSEPEGPTDEELDELWAEIDGGGAIWAWQNYARAVLARYARPTIKPVPVAERLPGLEDCDAEGRCWWEYPESKRIVYDMNPIDREEITTPPAYYLQKRHPLCGPNQRWLPHHALPLPQQPS
jgi:hypothetical protein